MAKIKFITVRGQGNLAQEPFYIGIPQHERSLTLREAYELCAEHTGMDVLPRKLPPRAERCNAEVVRLRMDCEQASEMGWAGRCGLPENLV